jgi:hypothetical protein
MPSMQELAVGVLKRLGNTSLPQTDYYTNVTAKVPENKAWAPNLPTLLLGEPTTASSVPVDAARYPNVAKAWSGITQQYPGAAAASVTPMNMLQRLQGKVYGLISGNSNNSIPAITEGTGIRFNPSLESASPDEIAKTLLHESVHVGQRRNWPTQTGSDRANYKPGRYWTSPGEQQAYEAERQYGLAQQARTARR